MTPEEENQILKTKLQHAQDWMKREISQDSLKPLIEENIYSFFSPEALSNFPCDGVENIISAEIIYHHILAGEELDGMGVIIGYQKVIDEMVELYITKGFRRYCKKNNITTPVKNDPLEKSIYSVIEKKYILSLGRLYSILLNIQKGEQIAPYIAIFGNYLESRQYLKKALLDSDFLLHLERLMYLRAITDKRHSGTLSKKDTLQARNIIIGNFEDKNCLLSLLANTN